MRGVGSDGVMAQGFCSITHALRCGFSGPSFLLRHSACELPPTWERIESVSTAFSKPFAARCPHTLQHNIEPQPVVSTSCMRLLYCEAAAL